MNKLTTAIVIGSIVSGCMSGRVKEDIQETKREEVKMAMGKIATHLCGDPIECSNQQIDFLNKLEDLIKQFGTQGQFNSIGEYVIFTDKPPYHMLVTPDGSVEACVRQREELNCKETQLDYKDVLEAYKKGVQNYLLKKSA